MEIIKVGICRDKEGFAQALARGLAMESRAMTFHLISGKEDRQDCQMILAMEENTDPRWVYLAEDGGEYDQMDKLPYQLFRYEDAQTMVKHLLLIYFSMTGKVMNCSGNRTCKLLISTAECGGAGATSLAISLGRTVYTLYGYKCLYVNLCPINDGAKYLKPAQSPLMVKLLYYLDRGKPFPLEPFISSADEIDYINFDLINGRIHEVTAEILDSLLSAIDELGIYQYVIIDLGNHLTREKYKLLESAEYTLYLRHWKREMAKWYRDKLFTELVRHSMEGKMVIVNNFVDDSWAEEDLTQFYIEISQETFHLDEDGRIQIKLNHGYGLSIATIAKMIVEEDVRHG